MHPVTKTPDPVTLVRLVVVHFETPFGGDTCRVVTQNSVTYASLDSFARQASYRLTTQLVGRLDQPGYVLIDVDGGVIAPYRVAAHRAAAGIDDTPRWVRRAPHRFRDGPVPFTGKRGRYSNYLRYPRTLQELRATVAIEDGEPRPRGRRGRGYLPTARDDNYRHTERNWKRQRRTQWKTR